MLRSEIQRKTGLTRKAIEYYEERGLIKPFKAENGYRDYSEKDLEVLTKVAIFRKIGMSIAEIEECLSAVVNSLSSSFRKTAGYCGSFCWNLVNLEVKGQETSIELFILTPYDVYAYHI